MDQEIQTDRLTLRLADMRDAAAITEHIQDPRIHRNVGRIKAGQTLEETKAVIKRWEDGRASHRDHVYAVMHNNELSGLVGCHLTDIDAYEIGYWLAPPLWGQGFATEAASSVVTEAIKRLGAKAFVAGYIEDNPPSGRVLRKLGFLPCGRSQYFVFGRQETCVSVDMALVV